MIQWKTWCAVSVSNTNICLFIWLRCILTQTKQPLNSLSVITYFCGGPKCLWKSGNTLQTDVYKRTNEYFFYYSYNNFYFYFCRFNVNIPFFTILENFSLCYSKDKLIKVLKVIFNRNNCLYVTFMISQLRIRNGLRCYVFLWLCLCLIKRTVSN